MSFWVAHPDKKNTGKAPIIINFVFIFIAKMGFALSNDSLKLYMKKQQA
jgi:hypothetical protein